MGTEHGESERRVKEVISAFTNTKRRIISAMPIVVSYIATLGSVTRTVHSGEVVFVTSRTVPGSERWAELPLDVYSVRDEFLSVQGERQALDFLRATGEFLPGGDHISWINFKRWQRYAELVMERESLTSVLENAIARRSNRKTDPAGELSEVLKMLTGLYPHTYFGKRPQPLTEEELERLRRASAITTATQESAEMSYRECLAAIEASERSIENRQRELETWFREPPPQAYSIQWIPREPDEELGRKMQHGGAMIEFLRIKQELEPVLLIRPTNTIEAIAAAIYAERIAGVRFGKCPGCNTRFEVNAHKDKTYCGTKCKETVKKRRQRDLAKKRG
jgi:hypothetical protein